MPENQTQSDTLDALWGDGAIFDKISAERAEQDAVFGEQNLPDMTGTGKELEAGRAFFAQRALQYQLINGDGAKTGKLDWAGVLLEEVYEALSEDDPEKLKTELIQIAAVAAAWIQSIDRRQ